MVCLIDTPTVKVNFLNYSKPSGYPGASKFHRWSIISGRVSNTLTEPKWEDLGDGLPSFLAYMNT